MSCTIGPDDDQVVLNLLDPVKITAHNVLGPVKHKMIRQQLLHDFLGRKDCRLDPLGIGNAVGDLLLLLVDLLIGPADVSPPVVDPCSNGQEKEGKDKPHDADGLTPPADEIIDLRLLFQQRDLILLFLHLVGIHQLGGHILRFDPVHHILHRILQGKIFEGIGIILYFCIIVGQPLIGTRQLLIEPDPFGKDLCFLKILDGLQRIFQIFIRVAQSQQNTHPFSLGILPPGHFQGIFLIGKRPLIITHLRINTPDKIEGHGDIAAAGQYGQGFFKVEECRIIFILLKIDLPQVNGRYPDHMLVTQGFSHFNGPVIIVYGRIQGGGHFGIDHTDIHQQGADPGTVPQFFRHLQGRDPQLHGLQILAACEINGSHVTH